MKRFCPIALFRLSVLGPLASRDRLARGELRAMIKSIASTTHCMPNSKPVRFSEASIERWYYLWKHGGIEALAKQPRKDQGCSALSPDLQNAILAAKRDNGARSINTIIYLLEQKGTVAKGSLSRSTVHRLLQSHQLSERTIETPSGIERRSFVAEHCGDMWQGDVMHGPTILHKGKRQKCYLVSLMDDASRLITHSEFRFSETAVDIEIVLKQAMLKRGLPKKLIIDNGPAYRSASLQMICARLEIRLIYCRPYEPEGKGKLERWHSFVRQTFFSELDISTIESLGDLNTRWWAWLDQFYHQRPHSGLEGKIAPIERWRQDLAHVRQLGMLSHCLDDIFLHRIERKVRKDGCISWGGHFYEVPYELCAQRIILTFDPRTLKTFSSDIAYLDFTIIVQTLFQPREKYGVVPLIALC